MSEEWKRRSPRRAPPAEAESAPAPGNEPREAPADAAPHPPPHLAQEQPPTEQQPLQPQPPLPPTQEQQAAAQANAPPPPAPAAAAAAAQPHPEGDRWRGREPMYPPPHEYPMYPPPEGGGYHPPGMPPHYPPPGHQWAPYGPPPMGNYPMYPPYHQPGYPPPGPFPPPYYPTDPMLAQRYPGEMPHGGMPPHYGEARAGRPGEKLPPEARGPEGGPEEPGEYFEGDEEDSKMPATDTSSASRVRLYVKSKIPTRQEVLDRRARKNAQSRARAAKLRQRIADIEKKPEDERTEEEREIFDSYQARRQRKNDRSRVRAIEKKSEIERILAKPEKKRTQIEKDFLRTALVAKSRKNQGDRLRRQRIKIMKKSGYGSSMSEIPMSPLPPSVPRHLSSPGAAYGASPGLMGYHSPARRPGGSSYMHPSQPYDTQASPATRTQLHMPQQSSNVAQHRHPDGSMTISIGGGGAGAGASFGGEQARLSPPNEGSLEVSQLLFDNGGAGGGGGGEGATGDAATEDDDEEGEAEDKDSSD